jgi:hypothetical protein
MIAHLVLFRLDPGVGRDDPRVRVVIESMAALPGRIRTIRGWEHGWNLTADDEAWDYGLRALFATRDDLHAYFEHPAHRPVLDGWAGIARLAFCDFEI